MDIAICALCAVSIILSIVCIVLIKQNKQTCELNSKDKRDIIDGFNSSVGVISQTISIAQKSSNDSVVSVIQTFQNNLSKQQDIVNENIVSTIKTLQESLLREQKNLSENLTKSEKSLEERLMNLMEKLDSRMKELIKNQEEKLDQIKNNTQNQIREMQEDNNKQLDKMRETVNEKLSKTINERFDQSFKMLSSQLESVYKSLGEMQNIATSVGSLTKVLSNVKTTGIFGEVQLGAILDQILTPEQYEKNFVTADAHEPVEYAIKFPGQNENSFVYLPIDSKFPLTVYTDLYNAYENNQLDLVKIKKEQLKNTIKSMAKDIKNKYIFPPNTTDFAVMFLPIEGLFAEVAKMGLIEELQATYHVTIAGPTTMSALLNSLQMGFRTLAIQKKSGEVWKILGAVKTEFGKINEIVKKIQDRFESTSKDFETLVGTRSRMLASKLKSVEKLDSKDVSAVLGNEDDSSDGDGDKLG